MVSADFSVELEYCSPLSSVGVEFFRFFSGCGRSSVHRDHGGRNGVQLVAKASDLRIFHVDTGIVQQAAAMRHRQHSRHHPD